MEDNHKILLIGSGMMSGPFIEYILKDSKNKLTIASNLRGSLNYFLKKFAGKNVVGVELDVVKQEDKLAKLVSENFLVISFVPPFLHPIIAKKCLELNRHMLTSSYVSPYMKDISEEVKQKGLIFFNEAGLDPGLDHIITHKVIHEEYKKGNKIIAFESWCGALPAPECSSSNPFLYKFSWSPRGALIAMNNSISQYINGKEYKLDNTKTLINMVKRDFHPILQFEGYYNRDSFPYIQQYGLNDAHTVIRGTLRYKGTTFAFQSLKHIGMFNLSPISKNLKTWKDYIENFVNYNGNYNNNVNKTNSNKSVNKVNLVKKDHFYNLNIQIPKLISEENEEKEEKDKKIKNIKKDEKLFLINLCIYNLSLFESSFIEANGGYKHLLERTYQIYSYLDLHKSNNFIKNYNSCLDATSALLESKLKMDEDERDMDFMQNIFTILTKDNKVINRTLDLLVFGNHNNSGYSATAITVGTPAAIVAQMIIDGKIKDRGVLTPTDPDLGNYILKKLEGMKIYVTERKFKEAKF